MKSACCPTVSPPTGRAAACAPPATALLNDLYQGVELDAQRQQQLISLFKLRFDSPQDMRADVRGKPVYLGLAMNEQGLLKLKPQNLLLNLPLASEV